MYLACPFPAQAPKVEHDWVAFLREAKPASEPNITAELRQLPTAAALLVKLELIKARPTFGPKSLATVLGLAAAKAADGDYLASSEMRQLLSTSAALLQQYIAAGHPALIDVVPRYVDALGKLKATTADLETELCALIMKFAPAFNERVRFICPIVLLKLGWRM